MADDVRSLVKEHHAFYEVLPYYVVQEEKHGDQWPSTHRIQAGFDIDIYGVNAKNTLVPPGADPDYSLGYAELKQIVDKVAQNATDFCSLEVMELPSTVVVDVRDRNQAEAMLRIRISHGRGLDQPAGPPEQHALEEVVKQLNSIGVTRR
jgi:hypothetical protein